MEDQPELTNEEFTAELVKRLTLEEMKKYEREIKEAAHEPKLSTVTSSEIGATLTRPLLRNAGFKAELEDLTQAERDLLYDLRGHIAVVRKGLLARRTAA